MTDTEQGVRDALRDLLQSDGWRLFREFCEQQYGDEACIEQIDRALGALPLGDQDAVQDSIRQIRASATAVKYVLAWPQQQYDELTKKPERGLFARRRVTA
jgi:hypothetical protein